MSDSLSSDVLQSIVNSATTPAAQGQADPLALTDALKAWSAYTKARAGAYSVLVFMLAVGLIVEIAIAIPVMVFLYRFLL